MKPDFIIPTLSGWSIICLRPSSQQAAVRRAVQTRGARHVSLPGLRLKSRDEGRTLSQVLQCKVVIFTSPAAVQFAARLQPLVPLQGRHCVAVGAGTAAALARHGIAAITPPETAMNSEGVLALPQWVEWEGASVGMVTAPGGRGVIAAEVAARGHEVVRANVYQRQPPMLNRRHHAALLNAPAPRAVLISSGEALEYVLALLPPEEKTQLLDSTAVCSSQRLAGLAREMGFDRTLVAVAPTTSALLDVLEQHALERGFR